MSGTCHRAQRPAAVSSTGRVWHDASMLMGTVLGTIDRMLVAETIGDYCFNREQRGIESFDACMREAESGPGWLPIFLIGAVALGIYLYNKGKSDQRAEQVVARPKEPVREDRYVSDGELSRQKHLQHVAKGYLAPGIPLPPREGPGKFRHDSPAGWYIHPATREPLYWDGEFWDSNSDLSNFPHWRGWDEPG